MPTEPFSPSQLSNLWLWLEPSRGTYEDSALTTPARDDGDPVGGWLGLGPLHNDVTQATAGNRPALRQIGGVWQVRGDGATDVLTGAIAAALKPVTIVAAVYMDSLAANRAILGGATTSGADFLMNAGGTLSLRRLVGGTGAASTLTVPAGAWTIVSATWASDHTIAYRINGVAAGGGSNNETPSSVTAIVMGSAGGGVSPLLGALGGMVVCTSVLSAADIAATEGYLAGLVASAITPTGITAPYATPAQYRAAIPKTDTGADAQILTDLTAVSRYLERSLGRFFTKDTAAVARVYPTPQPRGALRPDWAVSENPWRYGGLSRVLYVDDLVSLTSVVIDMNRDGSFVGDTALPSTDYLLSPYNAPLGPEPAPYTAIELTPWGQSVAWIPASRVQVTGVWGWPAVPLAIQDACIQLTAILRLESPRATQRVNEMEEVIGTSAQAQAIVNDLMRAYGRRGRIV